jgi:hypothetical protein
MRSEPAAATSVAALNALVGDAADRAQAHEDALAAAYHRAIARFGSEAARNIRTKVPHTGVQGAAAPNWSMPDQDEVLHRTHAQLALLKAGERLRVPIVKASMEGILQAFGLSFDVRNPLVEGVLENMGQHITSIAETTRRDVMRHLDQSWQRGDSIPRAARYVQAQIKGSSLLRGRTIARTEIIGAVNGGSLAAVKLSDAAAFKQWIATEDDRTREDHADADGQVVAVADPFDVGGFQMQYPGDQDGPPEEVINCRCTLGYADSPEGIT